jgi:hypothetical protein
LILLDEYYVSIDLGSDCQPSLRTADSYTINAADVEMAVRYHFGISIQIYTSIVVQKYIVGIYFDYFSNNTVSKSLLMLIFSLSDLLAKLQTITHPIYLTELLVVYVKSEHKIKKLRP